jgi:outer membrane protein assembly factor BamC
MKRSASLSVLVASALLAACSSTSPLDKKLDYKSDTPASKSSLEVPPDLTQPQVQNKYSIPGTGSTSLSSYQQTQPAAQAGAPAAAATAPSAGGVLTAVDNVHIERAGSQRWLSVGKKTPEELWPVLKAFWQDNGFVIKSEEPDVGIMETDWAENRAKLPNDGLRKLMESVGIGGVYSTSERDKFRIRLEKTAAGTEVYFSHQGMEEVYTKADHSETRWQPRQPDPELEAAFLSRFMVRLGIQEDKAKQLAQAAQATPVANARAVLNGTQLELNDGFDRAWRRVGLALDRIGLVVTDRDRSRGTYYVHPALNETEAKNSEGFLSSLAFWRSKNSGTNSSKGSDKDYRVLIKANGDDSSSVTLTDASGSALPDSLSKNTLSKLRDELK